MIGIPKKKRQKDTVDHSAFDKKVLKDIWGEYTLCLLIKENAWEFHHIMGRRKKNALYSSVYNAAPISRLAHERSDLTTKEMQRTLFERASRVVSEALIDGRYVPTEKQKEIDTKFLQFIQKELYA